jgi:hypothetical protein
MNKTDQTEEKASAPVKRAKRTTLSDVVFAHDRWLKASDGGRNHGEEEDQAWKELCRIDAQYRKDCPTNADLTARDEALYLIHNYPPKSDR